MNFKKSFIVLIFSLFSLQLMAHEGHETATAKSLHGGMVKKSKNAYVEVLQEEGKIEIYISSHDYKNLISPELNVEAFAETKGSKIPLKLRPTVKFIEVVTDLKKEKHFKLSVVLKMKGTAESVVFPLEN
jgi:hypothetical protein